MAIDRATRIVQAMDKFVVFVVLMVLSNHMVLLTNAVHPHPRFLFLHPIAAANTKSFQYVDEGTVKASKPQVLAQQQVPPIAVDNPTNFKLQFVDSIFQIPIQTLKAVNNLVQTVTNNLINTGTLTGQPPAKASVIFVESPIRAPNSVSSSSSGNSASPNSVRPVKDKPAKDQKQQQQQQQKPVAEPSGVAASASSTAAAASVPTSVGSRFGGADGGDGGAAAAVANKTKAQQQPVTPSPTVVGVTQ